jgi:hypothetical protein
MIDVDGLFLVWECSACVQGEPHTNMVYRLEPSNICAISNIEVDMAIKIA